MTRQNKLYTTAAALAFGILLVVFIFILPLLSRIEQNAQRLIELQQTRAKLEAQLSAIKEFKKIANDVREKTEFINQLLIDPALPVEFVRFMEGIAVQNRLAVKTSSIREEKTEIGEARVFQIDLRGAFPDLMRFLEQLESAPYLTRVQGLQIGGQPDNTITASLSLMVFTR